jgi:hypothetical protein
MTESLSPDRNRWSSSTVAAYDALVLHNPKDELVALLKGYELNAFNMKNEGRSFGWHEIYESQEEVEKDCEWYPVENVTDEEWMAALGSRPSSFGEYYDARDEFEKEQDKKHRAWIHHIESKPISIEDAELSVCCGGISAARDILYECARHNGLIYRDVKKLCGALIGNGHEEILSRSEGTPALNKIFNELKTDEAIDEVRKDLE